MGESENDVCFVENGVLFSYLVHLPWICHYQNPIPLHKKKQQIRGYNQSEWISRGIMAVTGIPVDTEAIIRRKNTETQTQKSALERWENVDGIFELHRSEYLAGKHILIVDDVLTTGATTVACASRLAEIEGVRISVLTLAMAE